MDTQTQTDDANNMRDDIYEAIEAAGGEISEEQDDNPQDETLQAEDFSQDAPSEETTDEPEDQGTFNAQEDSDPAPDPQDAPRKPAKAPIDWPPELQEQWNDLPEGVRQQIATREQQMQDTMREVSTARKTHQQFSRMAEAYAPILATEGVDALQATESLFKTVAQLRMGTDQQKAAMVAEIINNYGVDIGTLDNILISADSGIPETDPEEDRIARMLDDRLAPLMQQHEQNQANLYQEQQQQKIEAQNEVAQFAQGKPHFERLRPIMADLIDQQGERGIDMSLEEAYDMAIQLDPEVKAAVEAGARNRSVADKRRAASTLNGRRSGTVVADRSKMTMRQQLDEAWNESGKI